MRLALLGDPVAHSLSPAIFSAAFAAAGIEGTYDARKVDAQGVRDAFVELRRGDLDGLNVTMPHKVLAASLCDRLDPPAARAGSVNTVIRRGDEVVGFTTDVAAVADCLTQLPQNGPVLVLGAGGAAAAVLVALADSQATIYGASRRPGMITELAKRVGVEVGEVRWGVPVISALVINCTPIGMHAEELPSAVLELCRGLLDLPYASELTPALKKLNGLGKPAIDGLAFLLSQAGHGFILFTDRPAPLEAMRSGVEKF